MSSTNDPSDLFANFKLSDLPGANMTKTLRRTPYPTIDPSRPELSQAGKTILITGGATGIGYATARAFAQAGAATIIISSRRVMTVADAASRLATEFAAQRLKVLGIPCDVAKPAEVDALWAGLEASGILVDVCVLNAGVSSTILPMLDYTMDYVWGQFETNVKGPIYMSKKFYYQKGRDASRRLALLNVSTGAIHSRDIAKPLSNYVLTKTSGTLVFQQIAKDITPDDMQVISYHPGVVATDMLAEYESEGMEVTPIEIPAHFAVWAASTEASFLQGRFVWAEWDVDELKGDEFRQRVEKDPGFLTIGVHGL